MVDVRGKGAGGLVNDDDVREPFEIELTVEVPAGGSVRVVEALLRPTGEEPITPRVLRWAADALDDFADYLGARAVRAYQAQHGQLPSTVLDGAEALSLANGGIEEPVADFAWPDSGVVLGPRFIQGAQVELARRRKSRWSVAQYEQAAEAYREAIAAGDPVQQAIADRFHVSKSRAAAIILECRKRHLLGPARRGRKQTT